MPFTIEDLDAVLEHKNILELERSALGNEMLDRVREFEINGMPYDITWYKNICYLVCGGLKVPFYKVRQSGTWPNNKKLNLQFEYIDGATCAIIELEDY